MEFDARLAGAEIKGDKSETKSNSGQADTDNRPTLADKIKARKQAEQEASGKSKKPTSFSQGVGYQVIGG